MFLFKYFELGIALVPKIVAEPAAAGTTIRPVQGSLIHMTIGILCKASAYPLQLAGQKLYQHLKQHLSGQAVESFYL